MFGYL